MEARALRWAMKFAIAYQVNYVPVLDTGCDLTFAQEGTITLSGNPNGSNVTIELFERAVRLYSGVVRPSGSFSGSGSAEFTPDIFRHTCQGGIQGELQRPPTGIAGVESLLFDAGCPGQMVQLEITGRP